MWAGHEVAALTNRISLISSTLTHVNVLENGQGHGEDAINGLSRLIIPVMFFRQAKAWEMSFCTKYMGIYNVYAWRPDEACLVYM